MTANLVTTVADGVMHVELADPAGLNAMTNELFDALDDAMKAAEEDRTVRVVLLSARGKAFCVGANLKAAGITNLVPRNPREWPADRLIRTMSRMDKPIVAAVHGAAIGGGTTLLLSCDLVVAAEGTRFQLPFAQLGICSELASSYLLPFFVGPRKAREWLLLGEPFDVNEALAAGLVTTVVPQEQLMERARKYVDRLRANAPRSLRTIKRLAMHAHLDRVDEILDLEGANLHDGFGSEEMKESIAAFTEKRKADFSRFS